MSTRIESKLSIRNKHTIVHTSFESSPNNGAARYRSSKVSSNIGGTDPLSASQKNALVHKFTVFC